MTNNELDSAILSCVDDGWTRKEIRRGLANPFQPGCKMWNRVEQRVQYLLHEEKVIEMVKKGPSWSDGWKLVVV